MNRFMRNTLYQLKRDYGTELTLYLETATTNLSTGVRTPSSENWFVRRAVILPSDWKRKFSYALSFVAANKNFTYGGFFDADRRELVIDAEDLPKGLMITNNHHLVIDTRKYVIAEVSQLEEAAGWIIHAKAVSGESPRQVITAKARDRITFGEENDGYTE